MVTFVSYLVRRWHMAQLSASFHHLGSSDLMGRFTNLLLKSSHLVSIDLSLIGLAMSTAWTSSSRVPTRGIYTAHSLSHGWRSLGKYGYQE